MFLNNTFRDIIKQIKNLCVSANIFEKIGYVGGGKILLGSVGLAKNTDISLALIRKLIIYH